LELLPRGTCRRDRRAGQDGTGQLPNHPEILVIVGDTACVQGPDGKPLPGLAPVAKQQGLYVARLTRARLSGGSMPPFRYRHLGALADRPGSRRRRFWLDPHVGPTGLALMEPRRSS
jgi:NADH dehydrogenase FAD-containing subunit